MKILEFKNTVLLIQDDIGVIYSKIFLKDNNVKVTNDLKQLKLNDKRNIVFLVRNPYAHLVYVFSKKYPRYTKNIKKFHDFINSYTYVNPQLENLLNVEKQIGRRVDELYYCEKLHNFKRLTQSLGVVVDKRHFAMKVFY